MILTNRKTALIGGTAGLVVPAIALTLLWFGLSGDVMSGKVNLTSVFWPSYMMLVGGWRSTVPGVMITLSAVAINCLVYIAIAFLLRACIRGVGRLRHPA